MCKLFGPALTLCLLGSSTVHAAPKATKVGKTVTKRPVAKPKATAKKAERADDLVATHGPDTPMLTQQPDMYMFLYSYFVAFPALDLL